MEDGSTRVLACNVSLIAITTLCIFVKLYTRVQLHRKPYWDDVFAVIGYVFAMVVCVNNSILTQHGLGRRMATVSAEDLATVLQITFISELAYVFSFVAGKLAFVFFYLSLFPAPACKRVNYVLATILVLQLVEETVVVCLQCIPLRKSWDTETPGSCLDLITFFYVSFALKFATDVVLFCLPIPMLKSLNIEKGKKLGVMFMFSLGLLVCIVSVIRVSLIKSTSTDVTWLLAIELNWSAIEICSITICFCIPSFFAFIRLSPFFSSLFHMSSLLSTRTKATSATASNTPKSKSASSRVQNSYPLTPRSKWMAMSGSKGIKAVVTSIGDEEQGFGDSQVDLARVETGDIVVVEGDGEIGVALTGKGNEVVPGTIVVVKSVRIESMREADVRNN